MKNLGRTILGYALWAVSALLLVADIFVAQRIVNTIIRLITDRPLTHKAVGQFGALLSVLLGLILVIAGGYWYQNGAKKGKLWKRFGIVTAIQLVILLIPLIFL